jgi:hypothetical protein
MFPPIMMTSAFARTASASFMACVRGITCNSKWRECSTHQAVRVVAAVEEEKGALVVVTPGVAMVAHVLKATPPVSMLNPNPTVSDHPTCLPAQTTHPTTDVSDEGTITTMAR